MTKLAVSLRYALIFALGALLAASGANAADVTPNDTARFLAGLDVSEDSPLKPLTKDRVFEQHAEYFDRAWGDLEARQMSKVRSWAASNLQKPQTTLFYMFSGPDFLYADAFFPNATTYVMSGLELPGKLPDVTQLPKRTLPYDLAGLRASLNNVLSHSFFITSEMSRHLYARNLTGTLPVLYVFLARSGKTIKDVSFVALDKDGGLHPADEAGLVAATKGVKITFTGADNKEKTLYYFRTDLSNKGVKDSGFLQFCASLGTGDSLIKSASYLLHNDGFSGVREFLLKQSASIVQDDTGIPLKNYDLAEWEVKPFGNYVKPIPVFRHNYQPNMHDLFVKENAPKLDFIIGYRWRGNGSSLILATKKAPTQGQASLTPAPEGRATR